MKKLMLFVLVAASFFSCSNSKESKMKKLIEIQLKNSLNDWGSYRFVEMLEIDSTFSSFIETDEGQKMWEKSKQIHRELDRLESDVIYFYDDAVIKKLKTDTINTLKEYLLNFSKMDSEYVPEHDGWSVDFTFRTKNELGALTINRKKYYFNIDVSEIVSSIEL